MTDNQFFGVTVAEQVRRGVISPQEGADILSTFFAGISIDEQQSVREAIEQSVEEI